MKYENIENRKWWETKCLIEARKVLGYILDITSPNPKTEAKTELECPKSFIANEYALAYIFDLFASGKLIPVNRTDGGYNKKELIKQGFELYQFDENKDTFYRAVKHVASFDLNNQQHLKNISQSWIEAVKFLSKDWNETEKYLKEKELIGGMTGKNP